MKRKVMSQSQWSGVALTGYGSSRGPRRTVQDTAYGRKTSLHSRTDYFFRAGSRDYIHIRPPHNAQFFSTYRSVRLPSSLAFMRTTSIIGGPCYRQAPLAADFFFGPELDRWGQITYSFFYLPPSICLVLTVRTGFFCTRDHI